nr:hypothetical protein [Tanacetum cinerariifolium]
GRYNHIKDQDKNVISIDTFLKLHAWIETVISKGDPLLEDQCPKPQVTAPLPIGASISALTPLQKNLEKPNPKIAVAREKRINRVLREQRLSVQVLEPPRVRKKRRVQKNIEPTQSGSEVEKEVVDLSGNTRVSSPPVIDVPPSSCQEHHDTHKIHSQSSHHGSEDESVGNRYVPNWRLRNDLRVCTFHACKELVSHLATPAEDEFLGALSNVKVISCAYQTLGQSVVAQGEILKRHEQLNHDYNEGFNNKLSLIESAHSGCASRKKELTDVMKDLERERDEWVLEGEKRALSVELARSEVDRQKLVHEFIPVVVRRLHTSVEYRQALAVPVSLCYTAGWLGGISLGRSEEEIAGLLAETKDLDIEGPKSWETKYRELFAKQVPYVQKVADSYLLPTADLLRVSPDIPAPRLTAEVTGSTGEQANDIDRRLPPSHHEIVSM